MNEPTTNEAQRIDPLLGQVLAGQYEILERLGAGGMGAVYKARNLSMSTIVALKLVHRALLGDAAIEKRLQQEAKALGHLQHPNILRVFSLQVENASCFIVMEYVEGTDLAALIAQEGPLDPKRFNAIFNQIAQALGYAHANGIIHRDLKPSNIMLTRTAGGAEMVKLVDFGIAKILKFGDQKVTKTGVILGTPAYMCPELLGGSVIDARSDIYSLGCVMYEAATGSPPFEAETALQLAYKHLSEDPPAAATETYAKYELVIARALSKRPEDRYQNAEALATAIEVGEAKSVAKVRSTGKRKWLWPGFLLSALAFAFTVAGSLYFYMNQPPTKILRPDKIIEQIHSQAKAGVPLSESETKKLDAALASENGPRRVDEELTAAAVYVKTHQKDEETKHLRAAIDSQKDTREIFHATIIQVTDNMRDQGDKQGAYTLLDDTCKVYGNMELTAEHFQVLMQIARLQQIDNDIVACAATFEKMKQVAASGPVHDDAIVQGALFEVNYQKNFAKCNKMLTDWLGSTTKPTVSNLVLAYEIRGLSRLRLGKRADAQKDFLEAIEYSRLHNRTDPDPSEEPLMKLCRKALDPDLAQRVALEEEGPYSAHGHSLERQFLPTKVRLKKH